MPIINQVVAGGGTTPTGTIQITNNGTHDVTNYASADVNVPTTAPALYREFQLDANGVLEPNTTTTHIIDFTGVKNISVFALYSAYRLNTAITGTVNMSDLTTLSNGNACETAFYQCTGLTGANLSSLTTISGGQACRDMFMNCTGLTSINLSSLTTISGGQACYRMFQNCYGITSIDLSSLLEITNTSGAGSMFTNCTYLVSANLSSLTRVLNQAISSMFNGCVRLTNVDLSSLSTLGGNALSSCFSSCTSLTSLSFPCLSSFSSNSFSSMCANIPSITLHFPSNIQSGIESASGYSTTAPFGATSGTVLFDLPATYTLTGADSVTYTRNPKYDTGTALAWKVGAYGTTDFTPAYYTSGLTEPTVGTTIYSDAACTTSVTTVSAIA